MLLSAFIGNPLATALKYSQFVTGCAGRQVDEMTISTHRCEGEPLSKNYLQCQSGTSAASVMDN